MPPQISGDREQFALLRAQSVPIVATLAGSSLALLPFIVDWPAMPPFGFLMLLGWRLLRPELWPAWIGLPLGLFDDLIVGQPVGSAMFLWTVTLLLVDLLDVRLLWRDYWVDWLIAGFGVLLYIPATILLSGFSPGSPLMMAAAPQVALSVLCFPMIQRLCLLLDRWRLAR